MHWSELLLDQHRGMQSLVPWSSFAQDIAWYAEMALATFNWVKSTWHLISNFFLDSLHAL